MDEFSSAPSWWGPVVKGVAQVAGSYVAGSGQSAGMMMPTMSSTDPISSGVFGASGWSLNSGGKQLASSSLDVVGPRKSVAQAISEDWLILGGALVLLFGYLKS